MNYDLEERTYSFALRVRNWIYSTYSTNYLSNDTKQLVKSSGSVGANYIEANEKLSIKDFTYRIKICKKEAKESTFWLKLLQCERQLDQKIREELIQESKELMLIFASIIRKSDKIDI